MVSLDDCSHERARALRLAILEELAHTPVRYLQPERALVASLQLSLCPPPASQEVQVALDRLEADALIHCEVDSLRGKLWCITSLGRAALRF